MATKFGGPATVVGLFGGLLIGLAVGPPQRAVALNAPCPAAASNAAESNRYEFSQVQMGVPFRIALYAPSAAAANDAAKAAFESVARLDRLLSDYDPDSELSRLTRDAEVGQPVPMSPELWFVLERGQQLAARTDGAFDVTVGPYVRLWRVARRLGQLPRDNRMAGARGSVGYEHLRLDPTARTATLMRAGMRLDLGGIAKGYAADEALTALRAHGVTAALIDAGGDVVAGDAPPGTEGWTIGVAPLLAPDGPPSRYLRLHNASVATSGDAWQYVEIGGTRYSHIVDPRTGLGLTERSSVTIVAADGITADSLATSVSVLGPEKGLQLIEATPSTAALVVRLVDGKPVSTESARLRDFETPAPMNRSH